MLKMRSSVAIILCSYSLYSAGAAIETFPVVNLTDRNVYVAPGYQSPVGSSFELSGDFTTVPSKGLIGSGLARIPYPKQTLGKVRTLFISGEKTTPTAFIQKYPDKNKIVGSQIAGFATIGRAGNVFVKKTDSIYITTIGGLVLAGQWSGLTPEEQALAIEKGLNPEKLGI